MAREGWPVVGVMAAVLAGVTALAWWLMPGVLWWIAAGVSAALVVWGVWFFRDPERVTPGGIEGAVISAADGRVVKIDRVPLPPELAGASREPGAMRVRIAVFLNLFNVHVNRAPASGRIVKTAYVPGKFLNASLDKASTDNERSLALMVDGSGREVAFVQIAGLVARRIVNHLREGQEVKAGERFGLIRFGSRAEVYLPAGSEPRVSVGDSVRAGETVLAVMAAARTGAGALAEVAEAGVGG